VWQDTKRKAISFFAVTLSAQIATAPIQMATFGYLSLWSILLNCIFVPLISALFSILLLLVFVGCILPATWTATILYLPNLLWTVLLLAFEIVDFSSFALTGITLNGPAIVCYYLVCTLFTDKYNLSKKTKRILIFLAILAFGITMYALNAV
jgi:predicted membrane metal-binding protein